MKTKIGQDLALPLKNDGNSIFANISALEVILKLDLNELHF